MSASGLNWLDGRILKLQGPDRPWTIHVRANLESSVRSSEVESAWAAVVAARPELAVRLNDLMQWEGISSTEQVISGDQRLLLDEPLSPGGRPAVSVVADGDPTNSITLVANHALTDGLGCVRILGDLLAAMKGHAVEASRPVFSSDLDRLRHRRPAFGAALRQIPFPRPATLAGSDSGSSSLATRYIELDRVNASRRDIGVSLNSVLVAATDVALRQHDLEGRRVSLGIPADLRRHIGNMTGVGNAVANITVPTSRLTKGASFADVARRSDKHIARLAAPGPLGDVLTWYHRATRQGAPRSVSRKGFHLATAMLSNVGLVPPGAQWELARTVEFAPPAHQTLSVGIVGFASTLAVTVRARRPAELVASIAESIDSALAG